MINKLLKIIKEEVNNFDFLGVNSNQESLDERELLSNFEIQKQFICDSIEKNNIKIKSVDYANLSGNFDIDNLEDDIKFSIEYDVTIEFMYDRTKEAAIIKLSFSGDNIVAELTGIDDKGDYITGPHFEPYIKKIYHWNDIDVEYKDKNENKIDFTVFDKAPSKISELFIKSYLGEYISSKSGIEINNTYSKSEVSKIMSNYE